MKTKKKIVKGEIYFIIQNDVIDNRYRDFKKGEEKLLHQLTEYEIYDLMSGEEFASAIENGCIMDYDGHIAEIFVEDYVSNLGIWHENIHQGNFMVDLKMFRQLCKTFKIEVNWANK
jgi:hypothetical protein